MLLNGCMGHETGQNVTRNELEWLRQLRHKNIVSLLSIETDLRSRELVLVLEYCSYGSLDRLIRQPSNLNGLPEEQFLNFLYQFSDGLKYLRVHGITHRDIKPSNILCTKTEDGSIWYKITDFGATKDLCSDRPSVFGTEEYLHPDIFKCIIMDKKSVPVEMELRSELWSIGVTLYEVAAGKHPFIVPGGRKNKIQMFELLSRKKGGNISGKVDENSSQVEYSDCLPPSCWLSKSLSNFLECILRGLIENCHETQMTFEEFFPAVDSLKSLQPIKVFDISSMVICNVYFDHCSKFSKFKEEVSHITGIKEFKQFYIVRRKRLEVDDDDLFYPSRPDIKDETLILLPLESKFPILEFPYIGKYGKPSDKFEDHMWSLIVSGWCSQVYTHIIDLTQKQVIISDLSCKIQNILETMIIKTAWLLKNVDAKSNLKNATNLAPKLQKKLKNSFSIMTPFSPECLISKCSAKAETIFKYSVEVYSQFSEEKSKSLSHNEEQIHKYKKSKLEEKLKYLQELYKSCEMKTETMHDKFKQWYSSCIVKLLETYLEMEKTLLASLNLENEGITKKLLQNDSLIKQLEALVNIRGSQIERIIPKESS